MSSKQRLSSREKRRPQSKFTRLLELVPSASFDHDKTGFLDLPAELRIHIYEVFLEDLVVPLKHPWDDYPLTSRFQAYVNLLLTCRLTRREVKSLFRKEYADRIVLYFEQAPYVVDYYDNWHRHPLLANAQVQIRAVTDCTSDEAGYVRDPVEQFFGEQTVIDGDFGEQHMEYIERPGYYKTDCQDQDARFFSYMAQWIPPWVPEEHGFEQISGHHDDCHPVKPTGWYGCVPYTKLVWPAHRNNTRLTCYTWRAVPKTAKWSDRPGQPQELSCMVLGGKLKDLTMGRFNVRQARARLAWLAGEECLTDGDSDDHYHAPRSDDGSSEVSELSAESLD